MAVRREALSNNRENYLNGFNFPLCLLEENLEGLNVQFNRCLRLWQSYTNVLRGLYKGLPKATTLWKDSTIINGQFVSFLAFQESYIGLVRDFVNKLMEETVILNPLSDKRRESYLIFHRHLSLLS